MSVIRLLISGLLVASGLTLGTLTLYGAFDAPANRTAGAQGPVLKPWATKTSPTVATSDAKKSKRRSEKRPVEQAQKPKRPPQQAAAEWPWSWFGN